MKVTFTNMERIKDLLKNSIEYPKVDQLTNMPTDTICVYVNATFCTGLLNLLYNTTAFMIARYSCGDEMANTTNMQIDDDRLSTYYANIMSLWDISDHDWYHTKLGEFCEDDVLITGESDENYYCFWLDQDVSDCSIIKISKEHYENMREFNKAIIEYFEKDLGHKTKPIREPEGWINW